jgi:GT2 family glycosyltransferase
MQDAQSPGFSIVVPTHRRADLVERLLASLGPARAHFAGASEVLVEDSSPPAEAELIRQSCVRWCADYERTPNHVAKKRNAGIRRARYGLVFFIDSDCEADPHVLREHWSSHQDAHVAGVTGLTRWTDSDRLTRILEIYPALTAAFSMAAWLPEVDWATCTNLSVRKDALVEIGGFAEDFPLRVYGEDVDLGLRLRRRGHRIICNPQAVVLHDAQTLSSTAATLRKTFRTGRADVHLGEIHADRLAPEFPLPLATSLILLVAAALRTIAGGALITLIAPAIFLLLFVIAQSVMTTGAWPARATAVFLELAFEFGRLFEALPRLRLSRLWTKFVYVREQLAAERPRRVIQTWAQLASLMVTLLLFIR